VEGEFWITVADAGAILRRVRIYSKLMAPSLNQKDFETDNPQGDRPWGTGRSSASLPFFRSVQPRPAAQRRPVMDFLLSLRARLRPRAIVACAGASSGPARGRSSNGSARWP